VYRGKPGHRESLALTTHRSEKWYQSYSCKLAKAYLSVCVRVCVCVPRISTVPDGDCPSSPPLQRRPLVVHSSTTILPTNARRAAPARITAWRGVAARSAALRQQVCRCFVGIRRDPESLPSSRTSNHRIIGATQSAASLYSLFGWAVN
jgi:hypothetical protein